MGKTKEEKLGCLWEFVGYLILLVSLAWVIGNKDKMGTFGFVAYIVAAIIAVSVLKVKGRGGRGQAATNTPQKVKGRGAPRPKSKFAGVSQPPKLPDYAEKTSEAGKLIISRLPAYDPKRDRSTFFNEAREMNEKGWQLIVDTETISLLDAESNQLYQAKYTDIHSLDGHRFRVAGGYLPIPTWATTIEKTLKDTIIERADLVKIKTTKIVGERTPGGMVDREIETYYYGRKEE